ncbi:MAG: acetylglutamate kinase [Bacteroidales bacterium]|jgi:acetylglutamate kinase|nr:acetylglutamate kinase [Bacteroidales bacterium]MCI2121787.1 acetylglutamate kinase [Bacteroidales bacterium]MCI2146018.1 acetylglutamate kinase [Bacteroidales bacterium]
MKELTIVKIGGNVVDKEENLEDFLMKFASVPEPKILVHGGGAIATELCRKLGIPIEMHEGRRITPVDTLKIAVMTYAGLVNKRIVAILQKFGCNAIGLSGADGNTIPARKRNPEPIDYGFVGDVDPARIDSSLISNLMGRGITPVFCAVTHDENGTLLNTNADTMASCIAVAMSRLYSVRLIYCFEKKGVLNNPDDENSVIPIITRQRFEELKKSGVVNKGMIPKLSNAFEALDNGVMKVEIKCGSNICEDSGTLVK